MKTAAAAATVGNDVRTVPNLSPCMFDFSFVLQSNSHLSNLAGTWHVAIVLQVTSTAPLSAQLIGTDVPNSMMTALEVPAAILR